jgi:hypothetical protein
VIDRGVHAARAAAIEARVVAVRVWFSRLLLAHDGGRTVAVRPKSNPQPTHLMLCS